VWKDKLVMRYLKLILLFSALLPLLMLVSCKPAATPAPLPTVVPPQSVPEATREPSASPTAVPTPQAAASSGLHIIAKIGPTCPGPERPGQVCEGPYAGEFVITTGNGAEAARVTTNKDGRATVDLPPGQYIVTPKMEGRLPIGSPVDITVPAGQYVDAKMELDSGMR
jgi:hypothetical protein